LIAGKGEGNWYRRVYLEQGSLLEHRFVMESILGRALYPEEEVHHKNGRRWDNRSENLELWTRSHPIGVRVSDLLDYVVAHYREELDERLRAVAMAPEHDVGCQRDEKQNDENKGRTR
jgi:hypothetical protein